MRKRTRRPSLKQSETSGRQKVGQGDKDEHGGTELIQRGKEIARLKKEGAEIFKLFFLKSSDGGFTRLHARVMRLQQQRDFSAKIECIKWPKMSLFALNSAQMVQEETLGKAGAVTEGGDLGRKGARRGAARTW